MTATAEKTKLRSRPIAFTSEIPTERLTEFWHGLEMGKVHCSRCPNCGEYSFPPVADCPRCLHSGNEFIELDGEGEIETFTQVMIRPASFSSETPYIVAVAKMKEGVKALAWLTGVEMNSVKVGLKVKLVPKVTEKGPSYQFIHLAT